MKPMLAPLVLAFGCTVVASGCASVLDYTALSPAPFATAPRSADSVEVLSGNPPGRPYVEVGLIRGEDENESQDQIVGRMQQAAADHGCDALLLDQQTEEAAISPGYLIADLAILAVGVAAKQAPPLLADPSVPVHGFIGSCLVYTAQGAATTPAPPDGSSVAPPPAPGAGEGDPTAQAVAAERRREALSEAVGSPFGDQ